MSRVIREFPEDHELITFFGVEPAVLDSGVPWLYNSLDFATTRYGIEVQCHIALSYGQITTSLKAAGQELARFELRDAEAVRVVVDREQEILLASFPAHLRLDNFTLQLKPRVRAAWGNLDQKR